MSSLWHLQYRGGRHWIVGMALVVVTFSHVGYWSDPAAAQADQLDRIYDQILRSPRDVDLNRRYATLAIKRGELRKALAAYERILASDPNNQAAKAAIRRIKTRLKPSVTSGTIVLGGAYESNPFRVGQGIRKMGDGLFTLRGELNDSRRFGSLRWRSSANLYANYHVQSRQLDFGQVGFRTGPVFDLGDTWRVHVFAGHDYSWFDRRSFFFKPTAGLTFEFDSLGPLKQVTVSGSYSFISSSFTSRDAVGVAVMPRFVQRDILSLPTIAVFSPSWRYTGVTGSGAAGVDPTGQPFPLRHHALGARSDLFYQVRKKITLAVSFEAEYRHFFEQVTTGSQHRRDVMLSPGAQVIFAGLFGSNTDIVFHYSFDWNLSNDGVESYTNHTTGVKVLLRF